MKLGRLQELFPTGYHRGACKITGSNLSVMCNTDLWLTYRTVPTSPPEFQVDDLGFVRDFDK